MTTTGPFDPNNKIKKFITRLTGKHFSYSNKLFNGTFHDHYSRMEEERDRTELLPGSSSSAGEYPGEASTDEPELVPQRTSVTYNSNSVGNDEAAGWIRDDTSSCIIVVMTFWFFVSMTLILGVYGTVHLQLGPNSSLLIQPNPLFVDHITVEQVNNGFAGPMLYDFVSKPPLDVVSTWSETRKTVLHANSHKELIYYLNMGSQVNISYRVDSRSSSLILIIAQGSEGFAQWIEDPSYPNTTLAWKRIHGNGLLQQNITKSSTYYVAVANLNPELVEVELNLSVRAFAYDTSEAYYKCTLARGQCSMKLFFPNGNAAVLTTPGLEQGISEDGWYVRLSYGPRWITYLTGTVGMTALMLVALHFLNKFGCLHDGQPGMPNEVGSERAPLLSRKDNDVSSWGSSDDCLSEDEDLEEGLVSLDGKPLKDGENNSNMRRLCAICFDAPRDSFFLPCGHCVACFACGTRIAEAAGTCPICRRNMKKVRRIYTV